MISLETANSQWLLNLSDFWSCGKRNPKAEFGKKSNRKTGDFENITGRTDDMCDLYI